MCWKRKMIPKQWRQAKVVSLFKKGDRVYGINYRGVSLLDTAYKVYTTILDERLRWWQICLLSEKQMDFIKERSCVGAIFILKRIIEERREFNFETLLACFGFEKSLWLCWNAIIIVNPWLKRLPYTSYRNY